MAISDIQMWKTTGNWSLIIFIAVVTSVAAFGRAVYPDPYTGCKEWHLINKLGLYVIDHGSLSLLINQYHK